MPGLLDHAQPASSMTFDPKTYRFKGLLVGHTGAGKSTGAATAPGKKLVLEYDNRKESLMGHPEIENIEIIQVLEKDFRSPAAWEAAERIRRELTTLARKPETFPYDCIIEDGLSALGDFCMYWALTLDPKKGLGGSPAQQHYGPWIKNMGDHIQAMRNLPCSYILTAHFNAVEDEATGSINYFPKVYGKQFRTQVPGYFNEVYFCTKSDFQDESTRKSKRSYLWYTGGTGRYNFFKSAINHREQYWTDPFLVDLDEFPYGIQKLIRLREEKQESEYLRKEAEKDA